MKVGRDAQVYRWGDELALDGLTQTIERFRRGDQLDLVVSGASFRAVARALGRRGWKVSSFHQLGRSLAFVLRAARQASAAFPEPRDERRALLAHA